MNLFRKFTLLSFLFAIPVLISAQDLSFDLDISTTKSKQSIVMKIIMSGTNMSVQPQVAGSTAKTTILIDNATGKKYMLMDANGQKMALAINMKDFEKIAEAVAKEPGKEPKITVTKETKTIDGYKCTKVITETDDQTSDIWMTKDIVMNYSDFYKLFNATKGPQGPATNIPALKDIQGFPIEINSKDKAKSDVTSVKIKNISKAKVDPKLFSMEGYQVMDAGSMTR